MNTLALIYVGVGGAFGAMMRYVATDLIARFHSTGFPYGTMFVNVLGCLMMGMWLATMTVIPAAKAKDLHLLFAVGALGGFTTFSAFSVDVFLLAERGLYAQAAGYIGGSIILSMAALFLGMALIKIGVS